MFMIYWQMVDVCGECQCTSSLFDDLLTSALDSRFNILQLYIFISVY